MKHKFFYHFFSSLMLNVGWFWWAKASSRMWVGNSHRKLLSFPFPPFFTWIFHIPHPAWHRCDCHFASHRIRIDEKSSHNAILFERWDGKNLWINLRKTAGDVMTMSKSGGEERKAIQFLQGNAFEGNLNIFYVAIWCAVHRKMTAKKVFIYLSETSDLFSRGKFCMFTFHSSSYGWKCLLVVCEMSCSWYSDNDILRGNFSTTSDDNSFTTFLS